MHAILPEVSRLSLSVLGPKLLLMELLIVIGKETLNGSQTTDQRAPAFRRISRGTYAGLTQ